jgi:hypothetical protein
VLANYVTCLALTRTSQGGLGTLGGKDRAPHELRRVRNPGIGFRELERNAEEGRGSAEQWAVFIVVEKVVRLPFTRVPRLGGR